MSRLDVGLRGSRSSSLSIVDDCPLYTLAAELSQSVVSGTTEARHVGSVPLPVFCSWLKTRFFQPFLSRLRELTSVIIGHFNRCFVTYLLFLPNNVCINICTGRTLHAAVHCWRTGVSRCCIVRLEQSSTIHNTSAPSLRCFKKRMKPFLLDRSHEYYSSAEYVVHRELFHGRRCRRQWWLNKQFLNHTQLNTVERTALFFHRY